ncbi:bestrophin family protein [Sedimentitalea nanhaiensis]|uniref:Putative membrane protein n=1 Tax=Sedimentitalea nanhaiensis TaxID=999627 RepID=A0A1I7E0X6_9RHOB|nr:bestrophin family ion channel [Sedimentitalea nanhaiensis]SFU17579.1 putative membrane protein [Sedimentitalea nanhaiensis]
MIVGRRRKSSFELLFSLRGSVLPHIAPWVAVMVLWTCLVVWIDQHVIRLTHTGTSAFAVFGIALSLFLGFRNNAAYDRWWEGRKLWGQLITDSRALARETEIFLTEPAARERVLRLHMAFLHLHRLNLRGVPADAAARNWADADLIAATHPPCAALDRMAAVLADAREKNLLDGYGARMLAERMASVALAQAGCERIATTPLPFVYSLLIYRTSVLYCLLMPLGFVETTGWLTPLLAGVVAYMFFGLAEVTEELESPFMQTMNSLPLDAMCRTVEISLAPHLGMEAPAPLTPVKSYLG